MMNKSVAPMIVLFTDFGSNGPYVGQVKAVLTQQAPGVSVVDLLHDAPCFNPRASAHLLAAYISVFPAGSVVLGIVDPGVGHTQRKPVAINISDRWFVGPANGLFDVLIERALAERKNVDIREITWRPDNLSNSFHGRDLFAPVAARLANGEKPPGVQIEWPTSGPGPDDLAEVIFIDRYGNAITGIRASSVNPAAGMSVGKNRIERAGTFSDVPVGQAFCYENANGLMELSVNQGNAAEKLNLSVGDGVMILQ